MQPVIAFIGIFLIAAAYIDLGKLIDIIAFVLIFFKIFFKDLQSFVPPPPAAQSICQLIYGRRLQGTVLIDALAEYPFGLVGAAHQIVHIAYPVQTEGIIIRIVFAPFALIKRGLTLATAESCTGGNIARLLTAQAGASAYFKGGIVAYSNEVKESVLGVKHSTLAAHGAVSEATVREMAEGVRQRLGTDLAIATTGIAGPDGGTKEKPVGTVWIAVANANGTEAKLLQFGANRRQQNIDRSTNQAFAMLIRMICQKH